VHAPPDVVVHHVAVDVGVRELRRLARVLSPEERVFAERFRRAADRDRFVVTRATLRLLLGLKSGTSPTDLRFEKGPSGKPFLPAAPHLRFNVSHSEALALIAVSWSSEVGIDVERCDPTRVRESVARHFFSRAENAALACLPPWQQALARLRVWCRKEAYVKARGYGLSMPLDSFDVAVDPALEPSIPRLTATRSVLDDSHRWDVRDVEVGSEYVAAIGIGREPVTPSGR
jgi:4'-phosphopantetheinyl transferase